MYTILVPSKVCKTCFGSIVWLSVSFDVGKFSLGYAGESVRMLPNVDLPLPGNPIKSTEISWMAELFFFSGGAYD